MGYSLCLLDPKTREVAQGRFHDNLGSIICIGGTNDLKYNITYNYSEYFYEMKGFEKEGIRTIYGLTGKQSEPLLNKLYQNIYQKYFNFKKGEWKTTKRIQKVPYDPNGRKLVRGSKMLEEAIWNGIEIDWREEKVDRYEGSTLDYWEPTAHNAIKAVSALLDMAKQCPEGVWDGD